MTAEPFTIRIFVPDGDPEGVRIIDRMNWTGRGIVFPREKWTETKYRPEFDRPGVYLLVGYKGEGHKDELPTVYVGESDVTRTRIESHFQNKEFWDRAIVFTATNHGLNKAHVRWLEYSLIKRAKAINRCILDNANEPQEQGLSEAEIADTKGFLKEILQILPLVGLRAFEEPRALVVPKTTVLPNILDNSNSGVASSTVPSLDTIIVPARIEGFNETFLGENSWYAIRIAGGKRSQIKYIAAYVSQPISQITHYAKVQSIEEYGEEGKFKLNFEEPAKKLGPIPYGNAPSGAMQSPRYTSLKKLLAAKKLTDLF